MKYYSLAIMCLLAAIFAALRFFMPHQSPSVLGSYQAFTYVCIGGFLGYWLISRDHMYPHLALALFAPMCFFMFHQPPSGPGTYQAFAHAFVGGLFGYWLATRDGPYLCLALALCAVELIAFGAGLL